MGRRTLFAHGGLVALAALSCTGCADRFVATEALGAVDVRIVATFSESRSDVVALLAEEPFELALAPYFDAGEPVDIWVIGYTTEALVAAAPELAGASPEEIIARLKPNVTADGIPAPETTAVLHTTLRAKDAQRPYAPANWSEFNGGGRALHFSGVTARKPRCDRITVTRVAGMEDRGVQTIIALDGQTALFAGPARLAGSASQLFFGRVDGTAARIFDNVPTTLGRPTSSAWKLDRLYVIQQGASQGLVSRIGADGAGFESVDTNGHALTRLARNPAGEVPVAIGRGGLFRLDADADQFVLALPFTGALTFAGRGSGPWIVADARAIHERSDDTWATAFFLDSDTILGDIAVRGGNAVAVGTLERVIVRAGPRDWVVWPQPFGLARSLSAVALLNSEEFIVGGGGGVAAAWLDGAWCPIQTQFRIGVYSLSVAELGTVVYAGFGDFDPAARGDPFGAVRIEIPAD